MTNHSKEGEIVLVAKPWRNVHAFAFNKDSGALWSKGGQGELWISGLDVARGQMKFRWRTPSGDATHYEGRPCLW